MGSGQILYMRKSYFDFNCSSTHCQLGNSVPYQQDLVPSVGRRMFSTTKHLITTYVYKGKDTHIYFKPGWIIRKKAVYILQSALYARG